MIEEQIGLIRNSSIEDLKSIEYLEHILIPNLGLNGVFPHEYPQFLHKYMNYGLNVWQYPNQFAKYLQYLSTCDINSYIEIGTHNGGSFITTVEYINRVQNKSITAYGVDIGLFPNLMKYAQLNSKVTVLQINSMCQDFKNYLKDKHFDLCLIDGDHSYTACKSDYETIKNNSDIIVFHDIANDGLGVKRAWEEIDKPKIEFVEQYDKPLKEKIMGIGILPKP